MTPFQKLRSGALISLGYLLSPLSWWNDLFFNLPIALAFGYSISWLQPDWLLPGTVVGYWLSNVLGMVMLQFGATDLMLKDAQRNTPRQLWMGLGGATLYTVIVAALIYFHRLDIPAFLTDLQP